MALLAIAGGLKAMEMRTTRDFLVVVFVAYFLVASQLAEYYVIIEEGRSVKEGSMKDLANDKAAIHRFLGAA